MCHGHWVAATTLQVEQRHSGLWHLQRQSWPRPIYEVHCHQVWWHRRRLPLTRLLLLLLECLCHRRLSLASHRCCLPQQKPYWSQHQTCACLLQGQQAHYHRLVSHVHRRWRHPDQQRRCLPPVTCAPCCRGSPAAPA